MKNMWVYDVKKCCMGYEIRDSANMTYTRFKKNETKIWNKHEKQENNEFLKNKIWRQKWKIKKYETKSKYEQKNEIGKIWTIL